jgi:hypothetical protein
MRNVYANTILSALDELGDINYQRRVWIAGHSSEMSSFIECFSILYDDSALGDALDAGRVVFDESIDEKLRTLDTTLSRVNTLRSASEIIDDPDFEDIRISARRIAQMIRDLPAGTGEIDPGN